MAGKAKEGLWSRFKKDFMKKAKDSGGYVQPKNHQQDAYHAYQAMEAQAGTIRPDSGLGKPGHARSRSVLTSQSGNTRSNRSSYAPNAANRVTKRRASSLSNRKQQSLQDQQSLPAWSHTSDNVQDSNRLGAISALSDQTRPSYVSDRSDTGNGLYPTETKHYVGMLHNNYPLDYGNRSVDFANRRSFLSIATHDSDGLVKMSQGWENTFGKNRPLREPLPPSEDGYQSDGVFSQEEMLVSAEYHQTLEDMYLEENYSCMQRKLQPLSASNLSMGHQNKHSVASESITIADQLGQALPGGTSSRRSQEGLQGSLHPLHATDKYRLGIHRYTPSLGSMSAKERQGYAHKPSQPVHPTERSQLVATIIAPTIRDRALSARRVSGHENTPPIHPADRRNHVDFFAFTAESTPTDDKILVQQDYEDVNAVQSKSPVGGDGMAAEKQVHPSQYHSRNTFHTVKTYQVDWTGLPAEEKNLRQSNPAAQENIRHALYPEWKFPKSSVVEEKTLQNSSVPSAPTAKWPPPRPFDPFPNGFEHGEKRQGIAQEYGRYPEKSNVSYSNAPAENKVRDGTGKRILDEGVTPTKSKYTIFPPTGGSGVREWDFQDKVAVKNNASQAVDSESALPVDNGKHSRVDAKDSDEGFSPVVPKTRPSYVDNRVPSFEGFGNDNGHIPFDRPKPNRRSRTSTDNLVGLQKTTPEDVNPFETNHSADPGHAPVPNYATRPVVPKSKTVEIDTKMSLEGCVPMNQVLDNTPSSVDSLCHELRAAREALAEVKKDDTRPSTPQIKRTPATLDRMQQLFENRGYDARIDPNPHHNTRAGPHPQGLPRRPKIWTYPENPNNSPYKGYTSVDQTLAPPVMKSPDTEKSTSIVATRSVAKNPLIMSTKPFDVEQKLSTKEPAMVHGHNRVWSISDAGDDPFVRNAGDSSTPPPMRDEILAKEVNPMGVLKTIGVKSIERFDPARENTQLVSQKAAEAVRGGQVSPLGSSCAVRASREKCEECDQVSPVSVRNPVLGMNAQQSNDRVGTLNHSPAVFASEAQYEGSDQVGPVKESLQVSALKVDREAKDLDDLVEHSIDNGIPSFSHNHPAQARYDSEARGQCPEEGTENTFVTVSGSPLGRNLLADDEFEYEKEATFEHKPPLRPTVSASFMNPSTNSASGRSSFDIVIHMDRRTLDYAQRNGSLSVTAHVSTETFNRFKVNDIEREEDIMPGATMVSEEEFRPWPRKYAVQQVDQLVKKEIAPHQPVVRSDLHPSAIHAGGFVPKRSHVEHDKSIRPVRSSPQIVSRRNSVQENFAEGGKRNVHFNGRTHFQSTTSFIEENFVGGGERSGIIEDDNESRIGQRTCDEGIDLVPGRVANGRIAAERARGKRTTPPLEETFFGRGSLPKNKEQSLRTTPSFESIIAAIEKHGRPAEDPTRVSMNDSEHRKRCAPSEGQRDPFERDSTAPYVGKKRVGREKTVPMNGSKITLAGSQKKENQCQQHDKTTKNPRINKTKSVPMLRSALKKVKTHANLARAYKDSDPDPVNNVVVDSMSAQKNPPILSKSRSTIFDYMRGNTKEQREAERLEKEKKARIAEAQKRVDEIQAEYRSTVTFTPLSVILDHALLNIADLRARENEKLRLITDAADSMGVGEGEIMVEVVDVDQMDAALREFKHFYDVYRTYGGEQMGPLPELQLVTVRAKQTDFDQTARPAGVPFTRIDPMASSSRD